MHIEWLMHLLKIVIKAYVFATFFKITYEFKYQNTSDCMKKGFIKTRFNPNIKFTKATVKK